MGLLLSDSFNCLKWYYLRHFLSNTAYIMFFWFSLTSQLFLVGSIKVLCHFLFYCLFISQLFFRCFAGLIRGHISTPFKTWLGISAMTLPMSFTEDTEKKNAHGKMQCSGGRVPQCYVSKTIKSSILLQHCILLVLLAILAHFFLPLFTVYIHLKL